MDTFKEYIIQSMLKYGKEYTSPICKLPIV